MSAPTMSHLLYTLVLVYFTSDEEKNMFKQPKRPMFMSEVKDVECKTSQGGSQTALLDKQNMSKWGNYFLSRFLLVFCYHNHNLLPSLNQVLLKSMITIFPYLNYIVFMPKPNLTLAIVMADHHAQGWIDMGCL